MFLNISKNSEMFLHVHNYSRTFLNICKIFFNVLRNVSNYSETFVILPEMYILKYIWVFINAHAQVSKFLRTRLQQSARASIASHIKEGTTVVFKQTRLKEQRQTGIHIFKAVASTWWTCPSGQIDV